MGKKIMKYCMFGASEGITVYMAFTLLGSWLRGDGKYYYTSAHLIRIYGNEVNAVGVACLSAMILGMIWAAASLIYQETEWSLLRQTLVHSAVCVVPSLVIAYIMWWMPRNLDGLGQYITVFGVLYVLNWTAQYFGMKKRVRQMNKKLKRLQDH